MASLCGQHIQGLLIERSSCFSKKFHDKTGKKKPNRLPDATTYMSLASPQR